MHRAHARVTRTHPHLLGGIGRRGTPVNALDIIVVVEQDGHDAGDVLISLCVGGNR
jgi:hypothetical protein